MNEHSSFQDHCILDLLSLEKHSRTRRVRGFLTVKRFHEDPSLCPVEALVSYSNKVYYAHKYVSFLYIVFRLLSSMLTDCVSLYLIVGRMLPFHPKLYQDGSSLY